MITYLSLSGIKRDSFNKMNKLFTLFTIFIVSTTTLHSQTLVGIAPGESSQVVREPSISILPVTNVTIEIMGKDSLYVTGILDSFSIITGTIRIKTYYSLFVSPTAPIGELSIEVLLIYDSENVLTQNVNEDFLIDTTVLPSIVADFTADPITGVAPLSVNFNNQSTGNIIGYAWDFGDSMTSSEQNPTHSYVVPGVYTVSLTVFNFTVQNKKINQDYINVLDATSINEDKFNPNDFHLSQNYPNPFNPKTIISYHLKVNSNVNLTIFDVYGREVKTLVNKTEPAGKYNVIFDAEDLASGVYYYKLRTGKEYTKTKKMLLVQ